MSIKRIPRKFIIHLVGGPLSQTPQDMQGRKWLLGQMEERAVRSWLAGIDGVGGGVSGEEGQKRWIGMTGVCVGCRTRCRKR